MGVVHTNRGKDLLWDATTELVQPSATENSNIEAVVAKVVRWLFVIVGALLLVVIVLSLDPQRAALEMIRSAHSVDERGAGRSSRYVHSQHGCRVKGASEARCVGDTTQRR